jgi:hypothetical protein
MSLAPGYTSRLMYLLGEPSREMIDAGRSVIPECVEAIYIGSSAPKEIFHAMLKVALAQAETPCR